MKISKSIDEFKYFKPTDKFINYIKNKDIESLRNALLGLILADRSFSKDIFNEAIKYVESELKKVNLSIYDSNKEKLRDSGKKEYTKEDFSEALIELKTNFCIDRINYIKKIGKYLYGNTSKSEENTNGIDESNQKKTIITQMNQSKQSQISKKQEKKIGVVGWILLGIGAAATVITIVEIVKHLKK